jgi:hypothetical protein
LMNSNVIEKNLKGYFSFFIDCIWRYVNQEYFCY